MKATIKRVIKVGSDPCYHVFAGEEIIRVFNYREDAPEDSIYAKSKNLADAIALAQQIESGDYRDSEEIVYQTPEPEA